MPAHIDVDEARAIRAVWSSPLMKPGGNAQGRTISTGRPGSDTLLILPRRTRDIVSELQVGDTLPVDLLSFSAAECFESAGKPGAEQVCVLDAGHAGRHIAADAQMVVRAAWG